VNLWASFRNPAPQRSARLYQALVNTGLASSVTGGLVPTQEPFLHTLSATATSGTPLDALEDALVREIERVRTGGITPEELRKAKTQLRARLVFENDSITNIAHQIGYFETIAGAEVFANFRPRIAAVTLEDVAAAARAILTPSNRTVGWFDPLPVA
jgi:zinc protease